LPEFFCSFEQRFRVFFLSDCKGKNASQKIKSYSVFFLTFLTGILYFADLQWEQR